MLFSVLFLFLNTVNAKVWYISATGFSIASRNSISSPSSLAYALANANSNDTLSLKKGDIFSTYPLSGRKTFKLKENLNGITFNSYSDPVSPSDVLPILTQSVKVSLDLISSEQVNGQQMYRADLSSIMTNNDYSSLWGIWVNGVQYMLARYPNLQDPTDVTGSHIEDFVFITQTSANPSKLLYPDTNLKRLNSQYWNGATLRIRGDNWSYQRNSIVSTNSNKTWTLDHDTTIAFANGFFLENKMEELDAPREYYYNATTKELFYVYCSPSICPRSGDEFEQGLWILPFGTNFKDSYFASERFENYLDVEYLNLNPSTYNPPTVVLDIPGTCHGTIVQDLLFTKSFIGLRFLPDSSNFLVKNSLFNDILSTGVYAHINTTGLIKDSLFEDIDFFGIAARGFSVVMDNLRMYRIGLMAGYTTQSSGVECASTRFAEVGNPCIVKNSYFKSMGYSAIRLFHRSIAENNIIEDWSMTLADAAAIYTYESNYTIIRRNTMKGRNYANIVSNNWPNHGRGAAIYIDERSYYSSIIGNTIEAIANPCFRLNIASNTIISNNDCQNGGISMTGWQCRNNTFTENKFTSTNRTGTIYSDFNFIERTIVKENNPFERNVLTIYKCNVANKDTIKYFDYIASAKNTLSCLKQ